MIPGTCEIRFDRRLIPEESVEEAEKELREYFQKTVENTGCKARLKIINTVSGYYTPENNVFVHAVSEKIEELTGRKILFGGELGGNDGTFFAKNGIPVVCHGTIRADTRFHGVNEFVYLSDLKYIRDLIIDLGKASRDEISLQEIG